MDQSKLIQKIEELSLHALLAMQIHDGWIFEMDNLFLFPCLSVASNIPWGRYRTYISS